MAGRGREVAADGAGPAYDPGCYLCPGNARVGGARNPGYEGVYVFDNDFPALLPPGDEPPAADDPLLVSQPQSGACRVVCYSPDHSQTMAHMPVQTIRAVIDAWTAQFIELSARPDIAAVTIFENRGEMMGASNPHPHGQIWATSSIPNELGREDDRQRAWLEAHGEPPAGGLSEARTAGGRADRGRERGLCRARALLGDLAVRDPGPAAAARSADLDRLAGPERDALADLFGG